MYKMSSTKDEFHTPKWTDYVNELCLYTNWFLSIFDDQQIPRSFFFFFFSSFFFFFFFLFSSFFLFFLFLIKAGLYCEKSPKVLNFCFCVISSDQIRTKRQILSSYGGLLTCRQIMTDRPQSANRLAQTRSASLSTSDKSESFCLLSTMNKLHRLI